MKFLGPLAFFGAVLAAGILVTTATQAQQTAMTDAHIQRIVANCSQASRALTQLHASDTLLRVNRGQLYDLVSTRLMARLNSRLSLNRLDGSKLVSVAAAYNKALNSFRSRYDTYEDQLSAAIAIDCTKRPVAFYDAVTKARELRTSVHAATADLTRYTKQYNEEFTIFRDNFLNQPTREDK